MFTEIEQAKKEGRKSRAKFAGRRYWKNNDPSVVLIYDTNGYVAGMQTAVSFTECAKILCTIFRDCC